MIAAVPVAHGLARNVYFQFQQGCPAGIHIRGNSEFSAEFKTELVSFVDNFLGCIRICRAVIELRRTGEVHLPAAIELGNLDRWIHRRSGGWTGEHLRTDLL